jgi:hypothetical protein
LANLVATDLIAASVMEAAFRAESGFSRRPSNPLVAWPCSLAQIAACVRFPAPDLPQDRLHVDLDRRLADVARAPDYFVGMPLHETIEDLDFALR